MNNTTVPLSTDEKPPLEHVEETKPASITGEQFGKDSEANADEPDWTPQEEKALRRKADLRVFPMLCTIFGLSLLDRINISSAYIAGMGAALDLAVGARYSLALLVFFITYALFEIPSNMVVRKIGPRIWLSFLVVAWGLSVFGMGFVHHWGALTACRLLLGMFEAGLFPGAVFLIGSWYTQYETAKRVAAFYSISAICSAFGPVFAYALSLISVGNGMFSQGWRWIFIIEGAVTIAAGLIAPFFLIEFPEQVKWLTPRERYVATARVQANKRATEYVHPTVKESMKMLLDWKIVIYGLQYFISACSGYAIAYFMPIILLDGMGFSYVKAQLLQTPPYCFLIIMSFTLGYLSDKYQTRWTIMVFQSVSAIVGLLITLYTKPVGVRYFGIFLAAFGSNAGIPSSLSYAQSNTGEVRKRGIVAAAMISVGACGGIAGSTIFRAQDAPQYIPGMWATISMQILYSIMTFGLSMYLKRLNRLADEGKIATLEGVEGFRFTP